MRGRIDFDQVGWDIGFVGINKAADDLAVGVEFGDRVESIFVQKSSRQLAVDLFADPAVLPVDDVIDDDVAGQRDLDKGAERVVAVLGRDAVVGFAFEFAVGGVAVSAVAVGEQPVLVVVEGYQLAVDMSAVAVVLVACGFDAVLNDAFESSGQYIPSSCNSYALPLLTRDRFEITS